MFLYKVSFTVKTISGDIMSFWDYNRKHVGKKLNGDICVDTLIIGAGMTGLMTAYNLRNKSSVCVVDASEFGRGVTLNTTAKITYFQQRIYTQIKSLAGEKSAVMYLKGQLESIKMLEHIIKNESIDCDFERTPSFVFANNESEVTKLEQEVDFLRSHGVSVIEKEVPFNVRSFSSFCVEDTYTFHPLKFLRAIYDIVSKKVSIYENTPIVNIKESGGLYYCYSSRGIIKASKVVIACHYPFFLFPYFMPIRSYIEKSYVIVSRVLNNGGYSCISSSNPVFSCRFYQSGNDIYQLSLSESHNTSVKQNDVMHFENVKKYFGLMEKDIVDCYSNVDIMTVDFMPYIGKIKNNMYIGTGYNTWGMTNSVLAGKILADLVEKRYNPYINIFNPTRKGVAFFTKIPYNLLVQAKSFISTKINKYKSWYSDNLYLYSENGKKLGVYIDNVGRKHIVITTCPHMGCSLIFNESELTWDCPCHSSRFSIDGECIKGPSTLDIRYPKN